MEPITKRPTGQLVLDYLTDTVVETKITLQGVPYVSPDSRKLITVDRTATGTTIIVQEITRKSKWYWNASLAYNSYCVIIFQCAMVV